MLAEAVKEDLRMLRERLAQCSAESVRHKELLRCLGKKQQELREAMEELRRENCDVARCFRNNRQELQELEGLVAQTKEHFQMENGEAGVSVEEAQKTDQWSELTKALQEQVEVKKLLRNKLQHLQERQECLREPRALRLLLFLAFLQIAILIVVVLKGDILDWVLPPKLAAAFGSRPARSQLF
ncbi:hypothetical protein GRJ2_002454300 [Grus japonensis]|uniref:Uncharacterized protein n=1 Tax=Grus japonensis TaxID=30415 RepID=A0ABC9XQA8_GRUJA